MNDNPNIRDARIEHQALPVINGIKHSGNFWIHLYPFRPFADKCSNQAYEENWY
jgi:hypothetical protein